MVGDRREPPLRALDLLALLKHAAGREQDLRDIAELERARRAAP